QLGSNWLATDPAAVSIQQGALVVEKAHNHPVWLKTPLPENVVIDLDVWTDSPEGDMKVEVFGDGQSFFRGDPRAAYDATGYVLVMGGWRNSLSAIVRQQEHGHDRVTRADPKVVPGKKYHWTIRRQGPVLTWLVDGQPFLSLNDPDPLRGPAHRYFGLSGWESKVHFDNLRIAPL
ncbi:MAG TPA: family 16 glycoside hydrolase, partial [Myxococcaceae bacterium]